MGLGVVMGNLNSSEVKRSRSFSYVFARLLCFAWQIVQRAKEMEGLEYRDDWRTKPREDAPMIRR